MFVFYLLDFSVCFYRNPPTQNFVHVLTWRMLLIVPLLIHVLISFNYLYCTCLLNIQRVRLSHHVLLYVCVRVCVLWAYGCTVVRKTVWTVSCQCDLRMISVLILKLGDLSHLAVQSSSPLWLVTGVGLVVQWNDQIWPISASFLAPRLLCCYF